MSQTKSRVLVPITSTSPDRVEDLALALCEGYGAHLFLLNPLLLPEQTPLDTPEERLERERAVAGEVLGLLQEGDHGVEISGSVRVGRTLESLIGNAAKEHDVDLVLLDAETFSEEFGLRRSTIRSVAGRAGCDVIVVQGPDSFEGLRTVLVSIAGGPHSELAVEVAVSLAAARDVWPDVLHVIPPLADGEERDAAEKLLANAVDRFAGDQADDWLLEGEDVAEAIVRESAHYDLTIIGTPERNRLKRFLFGSTTDAVLAETPVPVVVAWRHGT